jgi:hypothetical protein
MTGSLCAGPFRLGKDCGCEKDFNAWICPIDVLVQVCFDDAVVVQSQAFAEGILCDFESPVHITSQGGREIEADRQSETTRLQAG